MNKAISALDIRESLREAAGGLDEPVNVIVTGRAAALLHGIAGPAPTEMEIMPVEGLEPFIKAFDKAAAQKAVGLKVQVLGEDHPTQLPSTWRDRMRLSRDLTFGNVRVFLPAAADLSASLG